jgi:hypothetical protein
MVIISKTKDPSDSSAGAGVFFVLLATAAVSVVVALAVLGPITHDGGAVEPSHGGLSVEIMRCEMRDATLAAVQDWRKCYGETRRGLLSLVRELCSCRGSHISLRTSHRRAELYNCGGWKLHRA